jgi:hypothetical protein
MLFAVETTKSWRIAGWVLTMLPVIGLLVSAGMKLSRQESVITAFTNKYGYPETVIATLGTAEAIIALLYAVPATTFLGAILATGYLGGAIATHVRIGEPFAPPLILGVLVWAGLFLREARMRALFSLSKY